MTNFISPNELHKAACDYYLAGDAPQDGNEWALCVNFWAFNIDKGLRVQATVLMAKIMDCPLTEDFVRRIAEFQEKAE
jgi:hypothetical protein